jgi:hypothetical protein
VGFLMFLHALRMNKGLAAVRIAKNIFLIYKAKISDKDNEPDETGRYRTGIFLMYKDEMMQFCQAGMGQGGGCNKTTCFVDRKFNVAKIWI